MPYKAATQYDSLRRIYGPWFLQGAVVTIAGLFFALRPGFAARLPLLARLAVAASALLWMRTGRARTPSLMAGIQASLGPGLFAFFHMLVQHVFLAAGVATFSIASRWMADRMDAEGAAERSGELAERLA